MSIREWRTVGLDIKNNSKFSLISKSSSMTSVKSKTGIINQRSDLDFDSELDSLSSFSADSNLGLDILDCNDLSGGILSYQDSNSNTHKSHTRPSSPIPANPINTQKIVLVDIKDNSELSQNTQTEISSDSNIIGSVIIDKNLSSVGTKPSPPNNKIIVGSKISKLSSQFHYPQTESPNDALEGKNLGVTEFSNSKAHSDIPSDPSKNNLITNDSTLTNNDSANFMSGYLINDRKNSISKIYSPAISSLGSASKTPNSSMLSTPIQSPIPSRIIPDSQETPSSFKESNYSLNNDDGIYSSEDAEAHRVYALKSLSIIEIEFSKIRENLYTQKMAGLDFEMKLTKEEVHPELIEKFKILDSKKAKKLSENDTFFTLGESYFMRYADQLKSSANTTFLERKRGIKERIISDLNLKLSLAKDVYAKGISKMDTLGLSKYQSSFDALNFSKSDKVPIGKNEKTKDNVLLSNRTKPIRNSRKRPDRDLNVSEDISDETDLFNKTSELIGINEDEIESDLLELGIVPSLKKPRKTSASSSQKRKVNTLISKEDVLDKEFFKNNLILCLDETQDKKSKKKRKSSKLNTVAEDIIDVTITDIKNDDLDHNSPYQIGVPSIIEVKSNPPHITENNGLLPKVKSVLNGHSDTMNITNYTFSSNPSISPSLSQPQQCIQPTSNEIYKNQNIIKPSLNNILLPLMPQGTNSKSGGSILAPSNLLPNDSGTGNYYSGLTSISPKIAPNYGYNINLSESNGDFPFNNQFSVPTNGMQYIGHIQNHTGYNNQIESSLMSQKPIKSKPKSKDKSVSKPKKTIENRPISKSKTQKLKPKGYPNMLTTDSDGVAHKSIQKIGTVQIRERVKELIPIMMNGMANENPRIEPSKMQSYLLPVKEEEEKI
ncbi:hypothetical protein AYI68_g443 [Smittium mucronatum]|uniref:Uncharacterized protein n=1 Tax=Smittium mucronatum TaxID=133383 RepID=A0A1R0H8F3_9FUNG|nr:hypothetical protein AYI68_g443 [Smittium mucronatum]